MNGKHDSGLTWKALLVGTGGMALAIAMSAHAFIVLRTGEVSGDWFTFSAAIVFLLILFGLNPLLRLANRRWELTRTELLLVFVLLFIGAPMSTTGFAATFLSNVLSPLYFANPSNGWWVKLGRFLPLWLYPSDVRTVAWFWEGTPPGESIPWGGWASPLAYWTVIFAAIYGLMTAMAVLMRRQWEENERLIFPLMEVPLSLVEEYETGRRVPPMMRTRLFWVGLSLTVAVFGTQIVNHVNPNFPACRLFGQNVIRIQVSETWTELSLHLLPAVVAFGYLVKRDVLFSVWFFGFLAYFQKNLMMMVGYSPGPIIQYEDMNNPAMAWQSLGGLVVFVLVGLFMARRHLKGVARKIFLGDPQVDDAAEVMPYRSAGLLLGLSVLTLEVFFRKMGMTLAVASTLIAILIIFYLAVTRFVIEGGMALCRPSAPGVAVVIGLFGAKSLGLVCLGGLAACTAFVNDLKTGFMPSFANSLKLTEAEGLRKGTVLKAAIYALVFGSVFSLAFVMAVCYKTGAIHAEGWNLSQGGKTYFQSIVNSLDNIPRPDKVRLTWAAVGMSVMALLAFCRYNFAWWPVHPIGFAISGTWGVQMSLLSIFVAWAAKSLILRLGGVPLFVKAKPFFLGLLVGHLIAVAIAYLVDCFMGPPGLNIYV